MKSTTEVERWFAEKKPPTEATMRKVREIILGADRRMTEYVKYGTLTFGYDGGDFATMVQVSDKKQTSVMFNRGARIPGKFLHLEGSHPSARFMRFADPAEARARSRELNKIVAAWGSLTPADRGSKKSPESEAHQRNRSCGRRDRVHRRSARRGLAPLGCAGSRGRWIQPCPSLGTRRRPTRASRRCLATRGSTWSTSPRRITCTSPRRPRPWPPESMSSAKSHSR